MKKKIRKKRAVSQKTAEKFGIIPDYDLSKKEKKILKLVSEGEPMDFPELCRVLDVKPSKAEEKTKKLFSKGLLAYADNGNTYMLTAAAKKLMSLDKNERKSQKRFVRFLMTMNDEELNSFLKLCDNFKYTEDADDCL